MIRLTRVVAARLLVAIAPAALSPLLGCGNRDEVARAALEAANASAGTRLVRELPHAAFIRFERTKGEGLSRESWAVEILQAETDIWMTGSVRSGGRTVPVKESMPVDEFHELWTWVRGLGLDRLQLEEDASAPATNWKKSLVIDVVESSNRRIQSRHEWARPLRGHSEIEELEKRFQNMLVASSERELERQKAETDSVNAAAAAAAKWRADSSAAAAAGN